MSIFKLSILKLGSVEYSIITISTASRADFDKVFRSALFFVLNALVRFFRHNIERKLRTIKTKL